jgi:hypothetical protein
MGCFNPLTGYRSKFINENGKYPIVFKEKYSDGSGPITLPCGNCTGCRLEYSRQWALRCYHESLMHEENTYITLTYNEENLPEDHSIHKEELQKFFKRLRKKLTLIYGRTKNDNGKGYTPNKKISYFACGEYGENKGRPHYHAIIFGYDFPDKALWKLENGIAYFRSELLEELWPFGYSLIGNVTFESAAYVARYVMKKRKGDDDTVDKHGKTNKEYYMLCDPETGEVHQLEREFCLMSRRPGIGKRWFDKFTGDIEKDFVTLAGKKYKLPKYYDALSEKVDPLGLMERKEKRKEKVNYMDNTMKRLRVKEQVAQAKLNQLERRYENET